MKSNRTNHLHIPHNVSEYRTLFESLPGLYLVLDPELRIVAVTDAYLQATMKKREKIIGHEVFEVFPDNPSDLHATGVRNLRASLERVLRDSVTDTMPIQKYDIPRPVEEGGGFEERYWSPVNSPVIGPDKKMIYIIHRVEDITEFIYQKERKGDQEKLTKELREKTERIEAEVYSRTQEAADSSFKLKKVNEELEKLYEKTKELDRLKTQFFTNISHELRTPLSLILGPVEKWLETDELSDSQRRDLELVNRNAHLLLKHVNDLLDISKLQAGRMRMYYTTVDLAHLVRFIATAFESLAAEKGIHYKVDTPRIVSAQVDLGKCQRILMNLLSNAIKFTPAGGTINVSLKSDAHQALIEVQNTGSGIPPHLKEKIFEPFRQIETDTSLHYEGTGLGLSIVKEFSFLHNGSVTVESTPGEGALFLVKLPLKAPADIPVGQATSASAIEEELFLQGTEVTGTEGEFAGTIPTTIPKKKPAQPDAPLVLIVDDNRDMNAFEADILSQEYKIATAFNGEEGLSKAFEFHPDLIISDVMMPRMSGDEMVRKIRQQREMDDIPIIIITAKADEDFLVQMLKEGVQIYLRKPFFTGELLARVKGLIAEKKFKVTLRESEERFRTLADNISQLAWMADAAGNIFWYNKRWYEFTGTTFKEMKDDGWQKIIHPEHVKKVVEKINHSFKSGEPWEDTFPLRSKTGKYSWFLSSAIPINNAQGKVTRWLGTNTDITYRVKIEEELKKSEKKYRTIFEGSNDPIAVLDLERKKYLEVNARFCELTGYSKEDISFRGTGLIITPAYLLPQSNDILKRIREKKELIYDWEIKRNSGEIIPVQVSSRIIEMEGTVYLFSIFRDIRLVKEAQAVLKRDKETLEKIVKEKTAALLRAKRLSDLGTLAASIAHELRNPLTALELAKYNIERKVTDRAKIQKHLDVIEKKVEECNLLIDNLLNFTKLKPPEVKEVNLYQLLKDVEETAIARHTGTDVKLFNKTTNIEGLEIKVDPLQIAQVIDNVINNAYEALASPAALTQEKKIEIIAVYNQEITICVTDNGPGIEPGIQERIFQPFYSTKEKGTGLGLVISKQIIENHGGNISIDSEKGKGTTVSITIPEVDNTDEKHFS